MFDVFERMQGKILTTVSYEPLEPGSAAIYLRLDFSDGSVMSLVTDKPINLTDASDGMTGGFHIGR